MNTSDIIKLSDLVKELRAKNKRCDRLKQARKSWLALESSTGDKVASETERQIKFAQMERDKTAVKIHVVCVDLGLAEPRHASFYEPRKYNPTGDREYTVTFDKPRILTDD